MIILIKVLGSHTKEVEWWGPEIVGSKCRVTVKRLASVWEDENISGKKALGRGECTWNETLTDA